MTLIRPKPKSIELTRTHPGDGKVEDCPRRLLGGASLDCQSHPRLWP